MSASPSIERVVRASAQDIPWDTTVDVLVVGSGGAGHAAAIAARLAGAETMIVEKEQSVGGTTAKAGGGTDEIASTWLWICNHPWLADLGVDDPRDDALRYLCRLARPELYSPSQPNNGIPDDEFALLEAFYDNGRNAVAALSASGALDLAPLRSTYDYYADLPENKAPQGRGLYLRMRDGREGTGADIIGSMSSTAAELGIVTRTNASLRTLIVDDESDEVVGAIVGGNASQVEMVRARGGIVFATGGYTRNPELMRTTLRGPVLGGLASDGNTGDLVEIASSLGAELRTMNEAWYVPMVLDLAPYPLSGAFRLPGDSMILVNRRGHRVVDEKTTYNEMTRAFFQWDATHAEYPNLPLVMIYDSSVSERCRAMPEDAPVTEGGGNPLPRIAGEGHEIVADTWAELAEHIDAKLVQFDHLVPGARLAPDFLLSLASTISRWNAMAAEGVDRDFARGGTRTERARSGAARPNPQPNPTMHAFSNDGPYYAVVLVPGTLDTKGGPRIDPHARMVRHDSSPIEGLYGAGNCVGSPAGQAYWAGGTTLGLGMTFGFIAGQHAAQRAAERNAP